jgi:hypothetical protein
MSDDDIAIVCSAMFRQASLGAGSTARSGIAKGPLSVPLKSDESAIHHNIVPLV